MYLFMLERVFGLTEQDIGLTRLTAEVTVSVGVFTFH